MTPKNEPEILLDADVVRHFFSGHRLHQLSKICPKRFVMLEKVKQELCRSKHLEVAVCNFLAHFAIPVRPLPNEALIVKEYARLIKFFGEGESACMAVARYHQKYIASSNLRDIKLYCEEHKITYYTTMDLLVLAEQNNVMNETEIDKFISDVKAAGSRLPCDTRRQFKKQKNKI